MPLELLCKVACVILLMFLEGLIRYQRAYGSVTQRQATQSLGMVPPSRYNTMTTIKQTYFVFVRFMYITAAVLNCMLLGLYPVRCIGNHLLSNFSLRREQAHHARRRGDVDQPRELVTTMVLCIRSL